MHYLEQPNIRTLLDLGVAKTIPMDISTEFNERVSEEYPWSPTSINWSQVKTRIQLSDIGSSGYEELARFFERTTISTYNFIAIIFNTNEPALVTTLKDLLRHFDDFVSVAPQAFFVGALRDESAEFKVDCNCFVELNFPRLTGIEKVQPQHTAGPTGEIV